MRLPLSSLISAPLLLAICGARAGATDVPQNVRDFYNELRKKGSCTDALATGFYATDSGPDTYSYCADHLASQDVIYIQGQGGSLADMDIDCDGVQGGPQDDGRCSHGRSPDLQSTTAFQDTLASYNAGITDLNTYVHPYIVFGNSGSKPGWKTFDPTKYGVQPLSVVAVVCGNKLVYGIWGDTNGDDGDKPMVGETSLALATACEGTSMTGDNGYSKTDILYLAFTGKDAVPGPKGANWTAGDYEGFEKSIEGLGDKLVERVGSGARSVAVGWGMMFAALALGTAWIVA